MNEEIRVCRLDGCEVSFSPSVHNQTFCSKEHTRVFTNARILSQYHEKKNRVLTGRTCRHKSCGTILSQYNEDDFCSIHQQEQFTAKLKSWGWKDIDGDSIFI